jgi:hypothetical protein
VTDVSPHSKTQKIFYFKGEGSVNYHVKSKAFDRSGTLIGYITSGIGRSAVLEIEEDGRIQVSSAVLEIEEDGRIQVSP